MNKTLLEIKGVKICHDLAVFIDKQCILSKSCVLLQVESDDNSTSVVHACKELYYLNKNGNSATFSLYVCNAKKN